MQGYDIPALIREVEDKAATVEQWVGEPLADPENELEDVWSYQGETPDGYIYCLMAWKQRGEDHCDGACTRPRPLGPPTLFRFTPDLAKRLVERARSESGASGSFFTLRDQDAMTAMGVAPHPGWDGAFTTNQAEGAWPTGARVEKVHNEDAQELTPLGSTGAILGSIGPIPFQGHAKVYGYFVEWDAQPKKAVFCVDLKLKLLG